MKARALTLAIAPALELLASPLGLALDLTYNPSANTAWENPANWTSGTEFPHVQALAPPGRHGAS